MGSSASFIVKLAHLNGVGVPVEVFGLPHDDLLAVELLLRHVEEFPVVVDQVLAHVRLGRRLGEVGGALKVQTNGFDLKTEKARIMLKTKNY